MSNTQRPPTDNQDDDIHHNSNASDDNNDNNVKNDVRTVVGITTILCMQVV